MYPIFRGYSGNLAILMEGVMANETATKMRVLVIEDEPTMALLIKEALWRRWRLPLRPCRSADALSPKQWNLEFLA
jgi:hypothetical protein